MSEELSDWAQPALRPAFFIANILTALRDLVTSDSQFGTHLYKGEKTLVFVCISLTFAAAFGYLVVRGLSAARAPVVSPSA